MKPTTFRRILIAAALTMTAVAALADGRDAAQFDDLDSDSNGQISAAEMQSRHADRLARMDRDSNGYLSEEELMASANRRSADRVGRIIERLDEDGDGQLSTSEMRQPERIAQRFSRADSDGNGSLSRAEFEAAHDRGKRGKRKAD